MGRQALDYDRLVEDALRGVVREALRRTEREGMVGAHHFYVSFRTSHPGVEMADHLRAEHPGEMTIVLQHQFWDLAVDDDGFVVMLSFNGAHVRLRVPFAAVTAFADPSVQFGLQFKTPGAAVAPAAKEHAGAGPPQEPAEAEAEVEVKAETGADVVTLDAFRPKK